MAAPRTMKSMPPKLRERDIEIQIRRALGRLDGVVIWTNETGVAEVRGQKITYGLAVGSSDLIGIANGRFIALEVKTARGRLSDDQRMFLNLVNARGGFGAVSRSPEEALAAIRMAKDGIRVPVI